METTAGIFPKSDRFAGMGAGSCNFCQVRDQRTSNKASLARAEGVDKDRGWATPMKAAASDFPCTSKPLQESCLQRYSPVYGFSAGGMQAAMRLRCLPLLQESLSIPSRFTPLHCKPHAADMLTCRTRTTTRIGIVTADANIQEPGRRTSSAPPMARVPNTARVIRTCVSTWPTLRLKQRETNCGIPARM